MNLNTKQIKALVKELYPQVKDHQKNQLSLIEDTLKYDIRNKVEALNIDFTCWCSMVHSINIDNIVLWKYIWFTPSYSSIKSFKSNEDIVAFAYTYLIKKEFENKFWEEVTQDTIEHEIVLSTIWADNVEQLLNTVKLKLMK